MSKKKASGNTMTLKDFHGGSIPTDLPLPSAPGVVPRSTDRPGYDRAAWGNPMGRPDHRTRPSSSPSIRHFDDKTPFLSHTAHIGRHFDEDERKPLDGLSAPRRMVSDDSFQVQSSHVEVKTELGSAGRATGWQGLAPSTGSGGSYSVKINDAAHVAMSTQSVSGNSERSAPGAYSNAWTARKEMAGAATEPVQSAWAGQTAVSKLVHASAVEKVSSGRWQSKVSLPSQADVEVINPPEPECVRAKNSSDRYNRVDAVWGRESSEAVLARRAERGLNIEESVQGGRKASPDYEKTHGPAYVEVKEGKLAACNDGHHPTRFDGKFAGPEMQPIVPSEVSERPKLKLLPRTKPLGNVEKPVNEPKQEQQPGVSAIGDAETGNVLNRNVNPPRPDLAGNENVNQPVERPKLNLKPRSQPLEKSEGNPERERSAALFGSARPRELVLKERGIDGIDNHESVQHSDKVKLNVSKTERVSEHAIPSRQGERHENLPHDTRTGRKFEKKDNRGDADNRADNQRRSWRNENRRNNRESERQQQPPQERHPSPETWRKPVEPPKPVSPDGTGLRYGKAASAVELAQAFSRPFSDPKADERFAMQRGLPGRTQVPFSRLMSATPRQINGY